MTAPTAVELALVRLLFITGAYESRLRQRGVPTEERKALRSLAMDRAYAQTNDDIKSLVSFIAAEPHNMAEALRRLPVESA